MESFDRETSYKITWLQFIGSTLIVLRHASGYGNYSLDVNIWTDKLAKYLIDTIRFYGVFNFVLPLFFFLSGILFFRNFTMEKYVIKCKSRIKSLLIPYLFWNSFWMMFIVVITKIPGIANKMNQVELFEFSWNNLIQGVFLHKYNPVFWYVLQLLVYTLLSPILYLLIKQKIVGGVFCAVILADGFFGFWLLKILEQFIPLSGLLYYDVGVKTLLVLRINFAL